MSSNRILLLSGARPSRAWKFARRIIREVPGAEICGIVQQPLEHIADAQRAIARGFTHLDEGRGLVRGFQRGISYLLQRFMDKLLWFLHGCPQLREWRAFTPETLAESCAQANWRCLVARDAADQRSADFIRACAPNLIVELGAFPLDKAATYDPTCALLRVSERQVKPNGCAGKGVQVAVEHVACLGAPPFTMTAVTVPQQPLDGALGFVLKTDLLADDLLLKTAAALRADDQPRAAWEVREWTSRLFSPYVRQLAEHSEPTDADVRASQRCRSLWRLCGHTLVLASPLIAARNWYRRLTGRYPVVIIAQHLVSDRPHRMGLSTEFFWRQLRFLQRHYRIVSLADAVQLLRSSEVAAPTLALTFDDGYGENFVNLRAVADEVGTPVALFVATAAVEGHREFVHDVDKGTRGFAPMTWDQIRYWRRRGAEVGSHTRSHFNCGSADRSQLADEIIGSKNDLHDRLERPLFFSFPWGGEQHMSPAALELAASTYPHFLSCFGGENFSESGVEPRHLLRKTLYATLWELELELQSVFDVLPRLKGALGAREAAQFVHRWAQREPVGESRIGEIAREDRKSHCLEA